MAQTTIYQPPEAALRYIKERGYDEPYGAMAPYINAWHAWMRAEGDFYDYQDRDSDGRAYKVHRRSVRPANRVCKEWASLIMNERTVLGCEGERAAEWLRGYAERIGFLAHGQGLVQRAFGLGTGAWALWLDVGAKEMQVRRYDARMTVPLSWDDDGVRECAFCTRVRHQGRDYDQLQLHLEGEGGYRIETRVFDQDGREVPLEGVEPVLETGCPTPTFAVVRPAIENTVVDMSPYGVSVFHDAVDAVQAVDLAYDALFSEVDLGKLRLFVSDALVEYGPEGQAVPFGKDDVRFFRKLGTSEDLVREYAPSLRTESQVAALRVALQTLGDLTGFGQDYFDLDRAGGIRTAREVSSTQSALMRNVRKHENLLRVSVQQVLGSALWCARELLGEPVGDFGAVTVDFDDSIIEDTASEKAQDLAELNVTMNPWEFRAKWYGEDEETARANVPQAAQPFLGD